MSSLISLHKLIRSRAARKRRNPLRRLGHALEPLENRALLSGISLLQGVLYLDGTSGDDVGEVRSDGDQVVATLNDDVEKFQRSEVDRIVFFGKEGDDYFANKTDIRAFAYGGPGDDTLIAGSAGDVLHGGQGNDVLVGGTGNDRIYGVAGDNFIMGGPGDDVIFGGTGNDTIYGEEGNDTIFGRAGDNMIFGDTGNNRIEGGTGNDLLVGGDGHDVIFGRAGANIIYGGAGNDILIPGTGSDRIHGGEGRDVVLGADRHDHVTLGGPDAPEFAGLTQQQLEPITDAVFARWAEVGLDTDSIRNDVTFRIADLPGDNLAWTVGRSDGSAVIWVDRDASGQGWYVDANPLSDAEYLAVHEIMGVGVTEQASSGMDLFTVMSHEVGHVAGVMETPWLSVMVPNLVPGVRIVPDTATATVAPGRFDGPFLDPMSNWSNAVIQYGNQGSAGANLGNMFTGVGGGVLNPSLSFGGLRNPFVNPIVSFINPQGVRTPVQGFGYTSPQIASMLLNTGRNSSVSPHGFGMQQPVFYVHNPVGYGVHNGIILPSVAGTRPGFHW